MRHPRSPLPSLHGLIARKLGVCPYCMRASAVGAVIGWVLYAIASIAVPNRWVLAGLLAGASCFTLLFSAHLVAYMARHAVRMRSAERIMHPGVHWGAGMGRRQFLGLVLKAGAYALTIAFFRPVPALADAATCKKGRDMATNPATVTRSKMFANFNNASAAQQLAYDDLIATFRSLCETACTAVNCMTDPTSTCYPSGDPDFDFKQYGLVQPTPGNPNGWYAEAELKKCPCDCYVCGKVAPPSPFDVGHGEVPGNDPGTAGTRAENNADQKCTDFCAKITACGASKTCQKTGKLNGEHKKPWHDDGKTKASQAIRQCICKCQ